jgi:hypothetical protein
VFAVPNKKRLRITFLLLTALVLLACGLFSEATPAPTPIPPTAAYTSTPAATSTPSHPSFSREEVLEIPSISTIVGEGTVVFAEGEDAGNLTVKINGTVPIVEGYWCLCCVKTIRIEPNLRVPMDPFFLDTEAQPAPGGLISESMSMNDLVLLSPIPDDAAEFIVSGPKGATLTKEGNGFRLVEGSAYFLQTLLP